MIALINKNCAKQFSTDASVIVPARSVVVIILNDFKLFESFDTALYLTERKYLTHSPLVHSDNKKC